MEGALFKVYPPERVEMLKVYSSDYSAEMNSRALQWAVELGEWSRIEPKTQHTVAFVGSASQLRGLTCELEVMRLSLENYEVFLKAKRPDFLLVESCYEFSTACWDGGQHSSSHAFSEFLKLLKICNSLSIPTVFWDTQGFEAGDYFSELSRRFDYVFYADSRCTSMYSGYARAGYLPLAVQPRHYNPYSQFGVVHFDESIDFLLDGFAPLHRHPGILMALESELFSGLRLIDSECRILRAKVGETLLSTEQIIGSVSAKGRSEILKRAKAELYFPTPSQSPMVQQRMILEAAATKVIPIYAGNAGDYGLIQGVHWECGSDLGLKVAAGDMLAMSELQRKELAGSIWREVYRGHTFSSRLRELYAALGLSFNWDEFPLVSVLTPTFRLDQVDSVLRSFEAQSYPNKELVVVLNSNGGVPSHLKNIESSRDDVRFLSVPRHEFTGRCLKVGFAAARGDLVFKMDDDDFYGRNYVMDMVLAQRAVEADFFGKPPCLVGFENDPELYARKSAQKENVTFMSSQLVPGKIWVGGNSIAGKTEFLRKLDFDSSCYGAADTSLLFAVKAQSAVVCLHDLSSLVAMRGADERKHTWRVSVDSFKSGCVQVGHEHSKIRECWARDGFFNEALRFARERPDRELVSMALASIPERADLLHRTLLSVINQIDVLYVYLNGYESVPDFLIHPKVEVFRSQDYFDLGAAGKFYPLDRVGDGYFFSIDDDIVYPGNYVERMISTLKKYGDSVAVCVHGSIFASPLAWYFERTDVLGLKKGLSEDKFVTLVGSGCLAFHRKSLRLSFSDFYPDVMCDLTFSVKAREQGVPLVSVARPKNWLRPQPQISNNTYYDRMLLDDGGRTALARRFDWSFAEYGRLITAWLERCMGHVASESYVDMKMDSDFLGALKSGKVPALWDTQNSVAYHRRRLQKLMINQSIKETGFVDSAKCVLSAETDIEVLRSEIKALEEVSL